MAEEYNEKRKFPEKDTWTFLLFLGFTSVLITEFYQIPKKLLFICLVLALVLCWLRYKVSSLKLLFLLGTVVFFSWLDFYGIEKKEEVQEKTLDNHLEILIEIQKVEPYYQGYVVSAYNREIGKIQIKTVNPSFKPGDTCLVVLRYKKTKEYINPFSYSKKEALIAKGYQEEFELVKDSLSVCEESEGFSLEKLRYKLFVFSEKLEPLERGLFQTLVLGVDHNLPQDFKEKLKNQGLYHQLAISGFNLGIIFGFVYMISYFLLKFTPVMKLGYPIQNISYIISLPFTFIILLFSGFCPSAYRAFIFLCLYVIAKIFFIKTSSLNLLLLTALILLLKDPFLIGNLSFQLSFLATLGLILGDRFFKSFLFKYFKNNQYNRKINFSKIIFWIFYMLFLSLTVSISIFSLITYINGKFPLWTPINNLIATSFWSFIFIPGNIISAFLVFLNEDLAKHLIKVITEIFNIYCKIPFFEETISFSLPFNIIFLSYLLILIWTIKFITLKSDKLKFFSKINILLLGLTVCFLVILWVGYKNIFYVAILDVGRANAFVIKAQEKIILVDTGPNYQDGMGFNWTKFYLEPVLRKLGVKRIDLLIISHPDLDHAGGYNYIKETFWVKKALTGNFKEEHWIKVSPLYSPDSVREIKAMRFHDLEIFLLPGKEEWSYSNLNRESLVVYMEYKGLTILFPGDIDLSRFYRMKEEEIVLPVEVLISPHHGSKYGLSEEILSWFVPKVVITSGRGPYHPHPELVKLLEHRDLIHFSTSEKGALFIFPRDGYFMVCSEIERRKSFRARVFFPFIPFYMAQDWCRKFSYHKL